MNAAVKEAREILKGDSRVNPILDLNLYEIVDVGEIDLCVYEIYFNKFAYYLKDNKYLVYEYEDEYIDILSPSGSQIKITNIYIEER